MKIESPAVEVNDFRIIAGNFIDFCIYHIINIPIKI